VPIFPSDFEDVLKQLSPNLREFLLRLFAVPSLFPFGFFKRAIDDKRTWLDSIIRSAQRSFAAHAAKDDAGLRNLGQALRTFPRPGDSAAQVRQ
jgi:hypothetical protein